jgi:hypothetical protein
LRRITGRLADFLHSQDFLQDTSDANVYVGTPIVLRPIALSGQRFGLRFAAATLLSILGGPVALTRDPLQALHGHPTHPRDRGRTGSDWMDRVHRRPL